jgi:UDP-N-acetylglucosamine/UDP-N-acetylgalactosamine diphosphorylase
MPTSSPLIETFRQSGQEQVFAFFDQLSPDEQQNLLTQAGEIDLAEIDHLKQTLLGESHAAVVDLEGLEPAPYEPLPEHGGDAAAWNAAREPVKPLCALVVSRHSPLRAGRVRAWVTTGPRALSP